MESEYLAAYRKHFSDCAKQGKGEWIHRKCMLFAWDSGQGNYRRFAELFRQVLQRIPLSHRRRMFHHWRTVNVIGASRGFPIIHFHGYVESPKVLTEAEAVASIVRSRSALALSGLQGFELQFKPMGFDLMPDEVACDLIAHELAHVLQAAWGWRTDSSNGEFFQVYQPGTDWPDLETPQAELETRPEWLYELEVTCEIMPEWGFDDERITDWLGSETGKKYVRGCDEEIERERAAGLL